MLIKEIRNVAYQNENDFITDTYFIIILAQNYCFSLLILTFCVPNSSWYDCRRMETFLKKSVRLILHKSPKDQFETLELYSQVSGKIETCIKGYQRRQLENEESKQCNRYVL